MKNLLYCHSAAIYMYVAAAGPVAVAYLVQAPAGGALLQKGQLLEAAGNKAAAATAYQQAYAAYTSVDDSDGMIKALAKSKALQGGRVASQATLALAGGGAAARPPVPRQAAPGPAASPLAGKVQGGRPVGLFFMTRFNMAFNSLEKATYYFTPAGQVYTNPANFTAGGLAGVPLGLRGTFNVAGGQLEMKWADGHTSRSRLEDPRANSFNWDAGIFVGMGPFASARQLVGSFEGGNSMSSGGGSVAGSSGLTFRADGTFSSSRVATFSTRTNESTAQGGGTGAGEGHWVLAGWTLTLTEANGRVTRGVAYPIGTEDNTSKVTGFYFNNVAYVRQ